MLTAETSLSSWQDLAANKRADLASKIPEQWRLPKAFTSTFLETSTQSVLNVPSQCGILTSREIELTEHYDATSLVVLMTAAKVTSVEVVTAFCKRAAIAQQCVNCLTEILFDEALERARECDEYLKREGKGMGPLHGLPISLKDSFDIEGFQSTIGYISFLSRPLPTFNSPVLDVLLANGAVFYVKTNLPQSMMTADSHGFFISNYCVLLHPPMSCLVLLLKLTARSNNLFGRTLNPHNLSLTAGGSTGGEGALIAMRGSVLGLATDIAGSCRIPALCNGLTSFKPTASRIPFGGTPPGRLGSPAAIVPVIGPQGVSVRDCELLVKSVLDSDPWEVDGNVINVPWRKVDKFSRPLRFGLVRGHPKQPLHPPVARSLHEAVTKVKSKDHKIILLDDKIPDLWDSAVLAAKYFLLDPKKTPAQHVAASGEPWVPSIETMRFEELGKWEPNLDELWDMNVQRLKIVKSYHDLMVENQLDAILMAGHHATATPHDTYGKPVYTMLQNLLNYPAGMLPVGKAEKELDGEFLQANVTYEPPYIPEIFEGAPTTVQVMGRPMRDEELIEIMKVVEISLRRQN